jgi:NAD(P)-dependent dehydrogenase (short-subunit alcohol dehydrogenase family)
MNTAAADASLSPGGARLAGRIAFVTGAGGGIGRAICERFLRHGARVAAADIDLASAAAALAPAPGQGLALRCDVGEPDQVREAIARAVAHFGGLNVLVNIAGGSTAADGPVTEAPEAEFWRAIRLDLFGTFMCCKVAIPEIARMGGGSVINMASVVSLRAIPGRDCYTAAKGGIVSLTRSMALEYAAQGVRVNAIAPGITRTPRVMGFYEANPATRKLAADTHLLGLVEPEDIADMAVYLASEESRHTTGQIMAVDSGATMR